MTRFKFPLQAVITGRTRSGKSFLLRNKILPEIIKDYEAVYILSPTAELDRDWQRFIKKNKKFEEKIFLIEEFDENSVQELIELIGDNKREGLDDKYLIILDDITDLLNQSNRSFFSKLGIKARHYNISYIITTHKYRSLNRLIRNNATTKIFFKINSPPEKTTIVDELITANVDKEHIEELLEDCTGEYKSFMVQNSTENHE
jgi:hypothetical protein